jgi:hypothetical protein
MALMTRYHLGGYDTSKPAANRAEEWDNTGYTRWTVAGAVEEQRPLTADEYAYFAAGESMRAAAGNDLTLRDAARTALAANRVYVGTASPTAAQTTTQVKALSRQMNGLIRLALGQLDGID